MSDSIFRPLVNALPEAIFEMLQGIGEAAVAKAQEPKPHHRPSQTTRLRDGLNSTLGRYLCERYGWAGVASWRSTRTDALVIAARMPCGHQHRMPFDECALEDVRPQRILDLIDKAWLRASRRLCYCVVQQ